MNEIYFGHTTMTHGLKGQLKCFSEFEYKDRVLQRDFPIYIKGVLHHISDVQGYKNYYLIRIDNKNDINEVEEFRNQDIYIHRDDLHLEDNEYLLNDLIGYSIIEGNECLGQVKEALKNKAGYLLKIDGYQNFLIPVGKA